MTYYVITHIGKRGLLNFAEELYEGEERSLLRQAIDLLYDKLNAVSHNPYIVSFVELFSKLQIWFTEERHEDWIVSESMELIEDVFSEYNDDRAEFYDSELIYYFTRILFDYLDLIQDIKEIKEFKIEFIALQGDRFDLSFNGDKL